MLRHLLFTCCCFTFFQANAQWQHTPAPVQADISAMANDGDSVLYVVVSNGTIYRTNDGQQWRALGSVPVLISRSLMRFAVSAGVIYFIDRDLRISRETGFLRSEDQGATWEGALPGIGITTVMNTFSVYKDVIYAGTGITNLQFSTDRGRNWQDLQYDSTIVLGLQGVAKLSNVLLVSDNNGVYFSNNDGQSFAQLQTDLPWGSRFIQAGEQLYGLNYSGLYRWVDSASQFVNLGMGNLNFEEIEFSYSSNVKASIQGQLALSNSNHTNCENAWYYSDNNGQHWNLIDQTANDTERYKIAEFFQGKLWLGGPKGLYCATPLPDSSFNLTAVPLTDFDLTGFAVRSNGLSAWSDRDHYVYENGNWTLENPLSQVANCYAEQLAYASNSRIWSKDLTAFISESFIFDDTQAQWQSSANYPGGDWLDTLGMIMTITPLDNGFAFKSGGDVWWWSDKALSPLQIQAPVFSIEPIYGVYPTLRGKAFVTYFFDQTGDLYSLYDEQGTFLRNLDLSSFCGFGSLVNNFVYSDGRNVFRFCNDEFFILTPEDNDWVQWFPVDWTTGVPMRFQTILFFQEHEGVYYIGTMNGLYYATDLSGRFYPYTQPVPNPYLKDMRIKDNTLWIATYNDGFYSLNLEEQKSTYSDQQFRITNQPSVSGQPLNLQSLTPSPNGGTIRLFDLSGRLLLERRFTGGSAWDIPVPALVAGTYVVQVQSGQRVDVFRWVVGQ
jgi:hypothetical protein